MAWCLFSLGGLIYTTHFFHSHSNSSAWTPDSPAALFMHTYIIFLFSASPPSRRINKLSVGGYFSAQNLVIYLCARRANSSRLRVLCVFNFISGIVHWLGGSFSISHTNWPCRLLVAVPPTNRQINQSADWACFFFSRTQSHRGE